MIPRSSRTARLSPIDEPVITRSPAIAGAEKPLNAFETLTLAPIDRSLIAPELLTPEEMAWFDNYHASVAAALIPLLDEPSRGWLAEVTRPLR